MKTIQYAHPAHHDNAGYGRPVEYRKIFLYIVVLK